MADNPSTKEKTRIKIFQELHSLARTSALLYINLPFLAKQTALSHNSRYLAGNAIIHHL